MIYLFLSNLKEQIEHKKLNIFATRKV